uniref:Sugar phosphate transporter domain-containing protein n=1 Tax=Oryza meridionalis TaxID=40149 RepID=A0A0E0DVD3_9ORYZ
MYSAWLWLVVSRLHVGAKPSWHVRSWSRRRAASLQKNRRKLRAWAQELRSHGSKPRVEGICDPVPRLTDRSPMRTLPNPHLTPSLSRPPLVHSTPWRRGGGDGGVGQGAGAARQGAQGGRHYGRRRRRRRRLTATETSAAARSGSSRPRSAGSSRAATDLAIGRWGRRHPSWSLSFAVKLLSNARSALLFSQVSYMFLDEISLLTFSIGNMMKRISMIVSPIIIFHTPVRPFNALGAAIAILGTFLYSQK